MGNQRKLATILLIMALMASSLIAVEATSVRDIPKPLPPEFSVKIVAYPYDVPPETTTTTTIDEYTGKSTTTTNTKPGYHVENRSIEVTIKNPPFSSMNINESHYWSETQQKDISFSCDYNTNLFYNIRVKGHYGNSWKEIYDPYALSGRDCGSGSASQAPARSNSKYTIISIPEDFPNEGKIDFQVQAMAGYYEKGYPVFLILYYYWIFNGQFSDWSNTQVLTMGEVGTTAVPDESQPTPTPTIEPEPTPSITPTQTPSIGPTQPPTITSTEPVTLNQAEQSFNWEQATVATAASTIVALAVTLLFLHKRSVKGGV